MIPHYRPDALTWDGLGQTWRAMPRRAIDLIIALALTAVGFGGFVYLYFLTEAPNWIIVATGVMGCAGLYWLWEED